MIRDRLAAAATDPFGHAPYPLADTLRHRGDPGLFGPRSVTWRIVGDAAAFVGGIRALLVQAAHPEVVAGVADHSRYEIDPLGRLSRTSAYVTATAYGAMEEVRDAVDAVRRAHRPVRGVSHRGLPYRADAPALAAWVHNALVDSFLASYRAYGPATLVDADADRFVAEQTRLGRLLDADPLPETADDLAAWIAEHPAAAPSPAMAEAVAFLRKGPALRAGQRAGYRLLFGAAVATLPGRIRRILGLATATGGRPVGRAAVAALRWILGDSPSWRLALERVDAPLPEGHRFHRSPPTHPE